MGSNNFGPSTSYHQSIIIIINLIKSLSQNRNHFFTCSPLQATSSLAPLLPPTSPRRCPLLHCPRFRGPCSCPTQTPPPTRPPPSSRPRRPCMPHSAASSPPQRIWQEIQSCSISAERTRRATRMSTSTSPTPIGRGIPGSSTYYVILCQSVSKV